MTVLVAGGGIAGLTLGLTLHQLGIPFRIFERVKTLRPLGVGINLQPPAIRELMELGLAGMLDEVGVETRDYGFYTRTGLEIWTEPRGRHAGYSWPQYSVHRGKLQMALFEELTARAGRACFVPGARVFGYECSPDSVRLNLGDRTIDGQILIGADGIHSGIRATMYPEEGAPVWSGAVMWRGTSPARPFLSGTSMILAGNDTQRFVAYPITPPDPVTGQATINWIAERSVDPASDISKEDWNREVGTDAFLPHFEGWTFDWLDVPGLIRGADAVYEYPMVDRDPVERWTDGRATLIGDAAHATYPVGSSGASQAILDARILGAAFLEHGVTPEALMAYEARVRPVANAITLANRGSGPDAIMQMAEERCEGDFSRLDTVLPIPDRAAHAASYKKLQGYSVDDINARPPTIRELHGRASDL